MGGSIFPSQHVENGGQVRYLGSYTFLDHPEVAPDNNSSERELRPTATYRKVTGGFRSEWGPDLFAAFRSIVGTAARRGIGAYQAIKMTLQGKFVLATG